MQEEEADDGVERSGDERGEIFGAAGGDGQARRRQRLLQTARQVRRQVERRDVQAAIEQQRREAAEAAAELEHARAGRQLQRADRAREVAAHAARGAGRDPPISAAADEVAAMEVDVVWRALHGVHGTG